jgi:HAD superfamily hydrolase (TIGR01509 family)
MKLRLPPGTFAAYLFDCDGNPINSVAAAFTLPGKSAGRWNCDLDENFMPGRHARRGNRFTLNKDRGLSMPVEQVAQRKESLYFELLPQLRPVPEVLEHIEAKHGQIPFAVVSGSALDSVTASLATLNLLDRFDTLVCAGDYNKSKPDPEAFLLAATRLRVAPESCLVFEDTDMGIRAAASAGMASVKIPPPWERTSTN